MASLTYSTVNETQRDYIDMYSDRPKPKAKANNIRHKDLIGSNLPLLLVLSVLVRTIICMCFVQVQRVHCDIQSQGDRQAAISRSARGLIKCALLVRAEVSVKTHAMRSQPQLDLVAEVSLRDCFTWVCRRFLHVREDKDPEGCTSAEQLATMYQAQARRGGS